MRPLVLGCLLASALSLAIPLGAAPDPWSWLVWGSEVRHLDLDTTGGPSWKPLPVLVTTLVSSFGGAAMDLWLVFARAGGLLALGLAYRLGSRLASPSAGVISAGALVLAPGFLLRTGQGNSEPLLAALVLWAVERHLDGRRDHALALGFLAALVRPEVWPFLALYGFLLWRWEPRLRLGVAAAAVAVPLLWFGVDLVASGDPFTGAREARAEEDPSDDSVPRLGQLPVGFWLVGVVAGLAAVGALAVRWLGEGSGALRRHAAILTLAAGGFAWIGVVRLMTAIGYPSLARFLIPGVAMLCVVAGVLAVRFLENAQRPRSRLLRGALLAIVVIPTALFGASRLTGDLDALTNRASDERHLRAAVQEAEGAGRLRSCADIVVPRFWVGAVAWELGVPLREVSTDTASALDPPDGGLVLISDGSRASVYHAEAARSGEGSHADPEVLGTSGPWSVVVTGC